jgi:ABC-type transport system involved in multi-copper enzyme maturation permease subunit
MGAGAEGRPGWLGPLFYWDIVAQGRQGYVHLYRFVYAGLLLIMLAFVLGGARLTISTISQVTSVAMNWVLLLQFLAAVLLTPVFVVGVLLDEKRRGTLTLLLTTFLTTREIVVGKLAARLLSVVSVLAAGVPVIAILQLLGGINFPLTVLVTLLTFAWMLMIGMHSLHASLTCKTTAAAVMKSYVLLLVNVAFSYAVMLPFTLLVQLATDLPFWGIHAVLVHLLYGLLAIVPLLKTIDAVGRREFDARNDLGQEQTVYEEAVQGWKDVARSLRLTRDRYGPIDYRYLENSPFPKEEPGLVAVRYYRIPEVWDRCVLWKETFLPTSRTGYAVATAGSFLLGLFVFLIMIALRTGVMDEGQEGYNAVNRYLSAGLMLGPMLVVCLRAVTCLAEEHEQRTLSSLYSTPMSMFRILWEKWLGCFRRSRLLLCIAALLLLNCCLSFPARALFALPLYAVQLAFFSAVALWISAALRRVQLARVVFGIYFLTCLLVAPYVMQALFPNPPNFGARKDPGSFQDIQAVRMIVSPIESWMIWQRTPPERFGQTDWTLAATLLDEEMRMAWTSAMIVLSLLTLVGFALALRAMRRLREVSA